VTGDFADTEYKAVADPSHITITGPRNHVDKIDAATTDLINANGIRGRAVFTTNAYIADPLVQVVQATSIRVTVIVQKAAVALPH
jgi:YbbR domain-containing protein